MLARQIAFARAAQGERVGYVSLLTESHTRLLHNLSSFAFFDAAAVADRLWYVSGTHSIDQGGLAGRSWRSS